MTFVRICVGKDTVRLLYKNGELIEQPRGENGFGYDPYFFVPQLNKTAAELEPELKNLVSHRGKALRRLIARLKEGD